MSNALLNNKELSKHFNVTDSMPSSWVDKGCPYVAGGCNQGKRPVRGYDLADVTTWLLSKGRLDDDGKIVNLRKVSRPFPGDTPTAPPADPAPDSEPTPVAEFNLEMVPAVTLESLDVVFRGWQIAAVGEQFPDPIDELLLMEDDAQTEMVTRIEVVHGDDPELLENFLCEWGHIRDGWQELIKLMCAGQLRLTGQAAVVTTQKLKIETLERQIETWKETDDAFGLRIDKLTADLRSLSTLHTELEDKLTAATAENKRLSFALDDRDNSDTPESVFQVPGKCVPLVMIFHDGTRVGRAIRIGEMQSCMETVGGGAGITGALAGVVGWVSNAIQEILGARLTDAEKAHFERIKADLAVISDRPGCAEPQPLDLTPEQREGLPPIGGEHATDAAGLFRYNPGLPIAAKLIASGQAVLGPDLCTDWEQAYKALDATHLDDLHILEAKTKQIAKADAYIQELQVQNEEYKTAIATQVCERIAKGTR